MKRPSPLVIVVMAMLAVPARAGEKREHQNQASLAVEYGLDSLERRYYRPVFRFDFPFRGGGFFSQVEYLSRMNGRIQGAIDYWVDAGVSKSLGDGLQLELRLNHFCRHETLRDTPYIWNMNEVLARAILERGGLTLALGGGGFIGGSSGYRQLAVAGAEWRGFLLPELSLEAELKLVNFSRLYHEAGFSLALNRAVDIFFRNTRHFESRNTSYLGLRFRADGAESGFIDSLKVLVGASPFDDRFKLEVEGDFKLEFFKNDSRRVVIGVEFETPILNGDGFLAQFWPGEMIYDIGLDYEKRVTPVLLAAWVARYRLEMPVDKDLPFAASLFTGLALRNQPEFDALGQDVRYEVVLGYDFKRGLEAEGRLGLGIWKCRSLKLFTEMKGLVGARRLRLDLRLLASGGGAVEFRPYLGWRKDLGLDPRQDEPGKILFGLGFFTAF